VGATCEVRFTRYYDAPPDEVWAALTEPESLAGWLAPPDELELSPGALFALRLAEGVTLTAHVRAVERGRLLELDWHDSADEPSIVRFELTPRRDGTMLVLDHRRVNARVGMLYMRIWERHLGRLDEVVGSVGAAR
jgi:uncharacterized protein YndB with AHSA1/START domain